MDRRQRKSRDAIFAAFTELLSHKRVERITVGEIIARADVGRATFYAHFETKDHLLKALCEELFCHVFDAMQGEPQRHHHLFACDGPREGFLHLFVHLSRNDHHVRDLLSGCNNDVFLRYFREGLIALIEQYPDLPMHDGSLPHRLRVQQIAALFTQTVRWWMEEDGLATSPETVNDYFMAAL